MIVVGVSLALAGCGSSSSSVTHSSSSSTGTQTATSTSTTPVKQPEATGCSKAPAPFPRPSPHLRAPRLRLNPARTYRVTFVTNCGTFAIELDVKQAPKTAASFYSLVKSGFYNGLTFHRVAAGFVIQGGDPTGTGEGGPGYTVVEAPPRNLQYVRGIVAMAKTEAQPSGASGSQFFIITAANATKSAAMTPLYALVGKVVSGINVVLRIGAVPTVPAQDGTPTTPIVMSKVTVATLR
jgi:peptidyl-prolyl cis-trans isomerase B (cyclophilin B)